MKNLFSTIALCSLLMACSQNNPPPKADEANTTNQAVSKSSDAQSVYASYTEEAVKAKLMDMQIIVENGHIHIEFKQVDNMLFVKIEDNGIGRKESEKKKMKKNHKSMALNITKERVNILNKKYKSKATVEIGDLKQEKYSGTLVELYLPLLNENIKFD